MYTIKVNLGNGATFQEYTLGVGNRWYIATSSPLKFPKQRDAQQYAYNHKIVESVPVPGLRPYVRGDRGGQYSIVNRSIK